jgi:hypothetical protein
MEAAIKSMVIITIIILWGICMTMLFSMMFKECYIKVNENGHIIEAQI